VTKSIRIFARLLCVTAIVFVTGSGSGCGGTKATPSECQDAEKDSCEEIGKKQFADDNNFTCAFYVEGQKTYDTDFSFVPPGNSIPDLVNAATASACEKVRVRLAPTSGKSVKDAKNCGELDPRVCPTDPSKAIPLTAVDADSDAKIRGCVRDDATGKCVLGPPVPPPPSGLIARCEDIKIVAGNECTTIAVGDPRLDSSITGPLECAMGSKWVLGCVQVADKDKLPAKCVDTKDEGSNCTDSSDQVCRKPNPAATTPVEPAGRCVKVAASGGLPVTTCSEVNNDPVMRSGDVSAKQALCERAVKGGVPSACRISSVTVDVVCVEKGEENDFQKARVAAGLNDCKAFRSDKCVAAAVPAGDLGNVSSYVLEAGDKKRYCRAGGAGGVCTRVEDGSGQTCKANPAKAKGAAKSLCAYFKRNGNKAGKGKLLKGECSTIAVTQVSPPFVLCKNPGALGGNCDPVANPKAGIDALCAAGPAELVLVGGNEIKFGLSPKGADECKAKVISLRVSGELIGDETPQEPKNPGACLAQP
jgi:hypothetical protein